MEGLKRNLLSIGQLDDLGYKIEVRNKIVNVIREVMVCMKEHKIDANLYMLKGETLQEEEASVAMSSPSER